MIRPLGPAQFAAYMEAGDPLLAYLGDGRAAGCVTERWLAESAPKRFCAWMAYEPLLRTRGLRVLDVGAGFSSLSFALAERHDYVVSEIEAHGSAPAGIRSVGDWADVPSKGWDLVLSVDLFPNVDQRLSEFVRRFRHRTRSILTAYPSAYYVARRVGADELMTIVAPDWATMTRQLGQWASEPRSFFPNGRQVCLATA